MEGATVADLDLDLALQTAHEYRRSLDFPRRLPRP